MSFVVIGLNHTTAPIEVLEKVTVADDALEKALHDVSGRPYVSEAVVLSTCNRTEVYVAAERFHGAFQDVRDFLAQISFLAPERLHDHLYTFYDDQAIEHLFRVSAGVDSAVLGEHEILGQVKRAWQAAQAFGCVGPNLNSVFRAALEVGKRVRTETSIGRSIASVSQAAIVMADQRRSLANADVLLIGAGEMGGGIARSVVDRDPGSITVVSRTDASAAEIAGRIGATALPFADLDDALVACDVAFTATAAPGLVIDAARIQTIMDRRAGRPLLIVDVAMPRDVDPAAGAVVGIDLCDLDAVGAFVAQGLASRAGEVAQVTAIIEAEIDRHLGMLGQQSVVPLITEFRNHLEVLRAEELSRQAGRLADLAPEQRELVDEITRSVLNKVLHEPTVRLKESASSLRGERLAAALRDLFDLN